jgi:hypothetical protein
VRGDQNHETIREAHKKLRRCRLPLDCVSIGVSRRTEIGLHSAIDRMMASRVMAGSDSSVVGVVVVFSLGSKEVVTSLRLPLGMRVVVLEIS